ncbi:MAG: hypothetical protein KDJ29_04595 [Hyphomicrobiales bacterium]|nr:hypothetical protein [Hyphomicrobiales bacterium]
MFFVLASSSRPAVSRTIPNRSPSKRPGAAAALLAIGILLPSTSIAQAAPPEQLGVSTGLSIPRYVSLKSGTVNMRRGPARDHGAVWTYKLAGLPVEITAEFENWRKIRDWEGSEGWVFHTLLSGRRTVMVAPWQKKGLIELHKEASEDSALVARIEPRVVAKVRSCNKVWCRISGKGFDGYVRQKTIWGVYPDETLK